MIQNMSAEARSNRKLVKNSGNPWCRHLMVLDELAMLPTTETPQWKHRIFNCDHGSAPRGAPRALKSATGHHETLTVHISRTTQRWMRADSPLTSLRTSLRDAMDESPGVLIANAPWATPYCSASPAGIPSRNP